MNVSPKPLRIPQLAAMKARDEKIAALTAYDASFARLLDDAGVDVVLVGDSLGMMVQGEATTLPVTLDHMLYHTRSVARSVRRAVILADLPFLAHATPERAVENAGRLLAEGGAHMVKLEGGAGFADTVRRLVRFGIPVCGHIGLLPQSVHLLGGYRMQGRDGAQAQALLADALALEEAGCDLLVLECMPAELAGEITARLRIPTIGIGCGPDCDGQVLVLYDILDIHPGRRPRFSHNFMAGAGSIQAAVRAYVEAVRSGAFPGPLHRIS